MSEQKKAYLHHADAEPRELAPSSIDLAFQAHLAHYDSLRKEIGDASKTQNEMINYTVAIIAGGLTLLSLVDLKSVLEQPFILLVFAMLLGSISWAFLELEIRIHDIRRYIHERLSVKVKKLIGQEDQFEYQVLGMELAEIFDGWQKRSILRGALVIGKFAVAYIPAVLLIATFFMLKAQNGTSWTIIEIILLGLDLILALVFPIGLIHNSAFVVSYYGKHDSKPKASSKPAEKAVKKVA